MIELTYEQRDADKPKSYQEGKENAGRRRQGRGAERQQSSPVVLEAVEEERGMRKSIVLLLILGLAGCATMMASNEYGDKYNQAILDGKTVNFIQEGTMDYIWKESVKVLEESGYKYVSFSDNKQGFFVVKKKPIAKSILLGSADAWEVILKFTKAGEDRIRIDLLRASNVPATNNEVENDIKKITEELKIRTKKNNK